MVYVSSIEALYEELPWEPEVFADLKSLLVYVFGREILGDAAVVRVTQLYLVILMVKEVVDVHIIHVSLDILKVYIRLFISLSSSDRTVILDAVFLLVVVFFLFLVRLVLVGLLQPGMRKDLGDRQTLFWLQLDHTSY